MAKLLLDTHTFLWFLSGDARLTKKQKEALLDPDNTLFMSIASFWEMTIKLSLGKLSCMGGMKELAKNATALGVTIEPISAETLFVLEELVQLHKDPFDRIIIATAINKGYAIVTGDDGIKQYSIPTV